MVLFSKRNCFHHQWLWEESEEAIQNGILVTQKKECIELYRYLTAISIFYAFKSRTKVTVGLYFELFVTCPSNYHHFVPWPQRKPTYLTHFFFSLQNTFPVWLQDYSYWNWKSLKLKRKSERKTKTERKTERKCIFFFTNIKTWSKFLHKHIKACKLWWD